MLTSPTDDLLLRRIRGEFLEMPGMRLTVAQAGRLWGINATTCDRLLAQLVQSRFLTRHCDGRYSRDSEGTALLPMRMIKADAAPRRRQRAS